MNERWTHSESLHSLDNDFDATRLGHRCSQLNGMVLLSGETNDPLPRDDEFECLNVAVPKESLSTSDSQPLSVLVWVHG